MTVIVIMLLMMKQVFDIFFNFKAFLQSLIKI